jgi:integrase
MATKHKTNGEPARVSIPQPHSKPWLVVVDDHGSPVMEGKHYLGWHKATGTFIVGGTQPREYLRTKNITLAIFRFREWIHNQAPDAYQTLEVDYPPKHPELIDPVIVENKLDKRIFVRYDVPNADLWRLIRTLALEDPERFRRETGLRLTDEKPQPSTKLSDLLAAYEAKRKKPSKGELKNVRLYWKRFTDAVKVATVKNITPDHITLWEDECYEVYKNGSSKTLAHKFEYVLRVFNYCITKQIDVQECERVKREIKSRKVELPDLPNPDPQPISVEDFHKMLKNADIKWRAMLLTSLNLCFYPIDIIRLPKSAINWKTGVVIFDRKKTGQTTRVGILWKRTRDAIKAYMKQQPHNGETLFISQYGKPYGDGEDSNGFNSVWRQFREQWKVDVRFDQIRDGAYSAAIARGADITTAKILAGHAIGGEADKYVKRDADRIKQATTAIEKHYFGKGSQGKQPAKRKAGK